MTKNQIAQAVARAKEETKNALQIVYASLNREQREEIVKDDKVKRLFDLYGVIYETDEKETADEA